MTLKINLNLDNAAFQDGGTDETIRCITNGLENLRGRWADIPSPLTGLFDSNGDCVGEAKIID